MSPQQTDLPADNPEFRYRHIGTTEAEQARMLATLGYSSLDDLMVAAVPESIRFKGADVLPPAVSEAEALAELRRIASGNRITESLIGLGYYGCHTPTVIKRNILENPSWYTAYTPYQAEISQGRLEALINFQTMVTDLTGMKTANASMLDESTAVVEAMLLARRSSELDGNVFMVDSQIMPQTLELLKHRSEPLGLEVATFDLADPTSLAGGGYYGIMIQYPGANGQLIDPRGAIAAAKTQGAMVVFAADLLALTLIEDPGSLGADIVVGSSQRFGVPLGFGGPHAGYLAVRAELERSMPGRLIGVSVDADGQPAYRLTLQTREQHIRRERATSNICTAQVLLAVMAGMYAVYHGPEGLRRIAEAVHQKTRRLAETLVRAGYTLEAEHYFDTIRLVGVKSDEIYLRARELGISLLRVNDSSLGISLDETTSEDTLERLLAAFQIAPSLLEPAVKGLGARLAGLDRTSDYLSHPVFNSHHSETAMLRYMKRLADWDYALDRGMIPLGSCTMKLNATSEMEPVTWPEFGSIHPFAEPADVAGYLDLISTLSDWLVEVTGYDAISLQPNAGSQGELAGLLAIRGYHLSRGDVERTICLIPSSAHGTNAASAVLAGMKVVVVACDELGNVDLADLKAKIADAGTNLAALMVTYPSTHGVYEAAIGEICELVHRAGGQVYIDGANTNAVVGFAKFGKLGGDVSHLNLHKTFCIPHGGGGPGVGPVAAKAHLAPFLPGHSQAQGEVPGFGPVSAAPYGSASILPISWAYIRMMGATGLRQATAAAVLSANYVAKALKDHFPLLYTGQNGLIAHECIIDIRGITKDTGVTVDDVAKRLIDYGFHAPTMSFPVAGTLMIEPTESEPLAELDRFIAAMIAIREEIDRVAKGEWPAKDNPLSNAPHTARLIASDWEKAYSRETAVFPVAGQHRSKYWPVVRRVDSVYGDRNLVCSCPPPEAFA